ncbi:LysR family transcriptional regulator [Undibacterium sp. TS12]|uniref:LysR family transcriptional regulator n=1 Tax=Undibacterium sp. TS12 TaxID=2908202 RepID=UPI001F4C5BC8|nr:LysR family transcriptional regulator [Undibacterium sp. TS12]MCH8618288.1 LysR family transcriptional regulator [Undibacterium sp. TS12]
MMNLNKLKHAVVLAEQANFARAAEKLHISQPALSRSISGLEEELGVRLFDRDQAGAAATAAGRQLVSRARDLLYAAGNLRQEMTQLRDGESGQLAFGAGPFPAASFLPAVLAELARAYPRMHTEVEVSHSDILMEHLIAERLEFFVADTRTINPNKHVSIRHLGRQYGGLYCRREHPLLAKAMLTIADLQTAKFASVHLSDRFLPPLRKALGLAAGQDLPLITTCDNIYVLKHVVMHSDAILLCTRPAVVNELSSGELLELKIDGWQAMYAEIGIVSLERRSLSPLAELVLCKIAGHITTLPNSG